MSTNPKARAWMQIEADALRSNYARIGEAVGPGTRMLPMVKANAYGLGVTEVVSCLEPLEPWGYGVATVSEGLALRARGIDRPIVVCSPSPSGEMEAAVEARLQLSISSSDALDSLSAAAKAVGDVAAWHLDVDTGMGRSGFDWRCADSWLDDVERPTEGLRWAGAYTHLHSADECEQSVREQWARFMSVMDRIESPPADLVVHVLNSAGVFRAPEYAQAIARPGIFLYGGGVGEEQPEPEPVVSVHARVVHVREASEGTTLGYGSTYTAGGSERWGTLAIGYGDGLPRALSNRGSAIVGGVRVPIIGRISMDVAVVDVSGVANVREGAVATLIGSGGGERITLDEVAAQAGTISYEVLTGLTGRLPRVWT
jgi:alanine racemase